MVNTFGSDQQIGQLLDVHLDFPRTTRTSRHVW